MTIKMEKELLSISIGIRKSKERLNKEWNFLTRIDEKVLRFKNQFEEKRKTGYLEFDWCVGCDYEFNKKTKEQKEHCDDCKQGL